MRKKVILILGLLIINIFSAQSLEKIFLNKSLQKEVEYFIKYSKTSIDNEIDHLTIDKKEDSIYIIQTKKPIIIGVAGQYEPYDKKIKELIIYKDEVNNEDIKDLIFKDGKVTFEINEDEQMLFKNVLERDIVQVEPDIYLILKDLKGYVNYKYIKEVNRNKIWSMDKLKRKEVQTKSDLRNYLTFFINKETGNLDNWGFFVQDKKTFIEVRFGASCLNCQSCE
jgi:exoribonuclease R